MEISVPAGAIPYSQRPGFQEPMGLLRFFLREHLVCKSGNPGKSGESWGVSLGVF